MLHYPRTLHKRNILIRQTSQILTCLLSGNEVHLFIDIYLSVSWRIEVKVVNFQSSNTEETNAPTPYTYVLQMNTIYLEFGQGSLGQLVTLLRGIC